jgi:hypothetical protein
MIVRISEVESNYPDGVPEVSTAVVVDGLPQYATLKLEKVSKGVYEVVEIVIGNRTHRI